MVASFPGFPLYAPRKEMRERGRPAISCHVTDIMQQAVVNFQGYAMLMSFNNSETR